VRRRNDDREMFITEALYYAAAAGYYDTRVESEKPHITFMELPPPAGATHQLSILIDKTGYLVTRFKKNTVVSADDRTPEQQRERLLRELVLDKALSRFTGRAPLSDEERARLAEQLLVQENAGEPLTQLMRVARHPIVKDESPAGAMVRQWSVSIGSHRCQVGLVGFVGEKPELVILGE
jgi:hypothetical protein